MTYEIIDETKGETAGAMRDASRPYVVIDRYRSILRNCDQISTAIHGRYETMESAKRRLRYLKTGQ